MGGRMRSTVGVGVLLLGLAGCGDADGPEQVAHSRTDTAPSTAPSAEDGYVAQVNDRCRELLAQVLGFDIGNAVTIEQFLGKHEQLVVAIHDFDADVDALPVTAAERPAADAFDAYRRFSDATDATLVAAAETGDQVQFDAANAAYLELIHAGVAELDAMHDAGIQCNAR